MTQPGLESFKSKIARFCAYQERHHQEVRDKLYSYGLHQNDVEELITFLIQEDFLNEERFARAFAGGKFRMKKWGKKKITLELKRRKISDYCIRAGLEEINQEDYLKTMEDLAEAKSLQLGSATSFEKKEKIGQYLIRKGYETDIVWHSLSAKFRAANS